VTDQSGFLGFFKRNFPVLFGKISPCPCPFQWKKRGIYEHCDFAGLAKKWLLFLYIGKTGPGQPRFPHGSIPFPSNPEHPGIFFVKV